MVEALKTVEPDLVTEAERELQGGAPLVEDVVVPTLLNTLDGHDGRLVLMRDDFHRLETRLLASSRPARTRRPPPRPECLGSPSGGSFHYPPTKVRMSLARLAYPGRTDTWPEQEERR